MKDGLRYRGSDRKIKDKLKEDASHKEALIFTPFGSDVKNDRNISFVIEHPRYHNPPKDVKVSYAYGIEPNVLTKIWNDAQILYTDVTGQFGISQNFAAIKRPTGNKINASYAKLINWVKSTPSALKKFYDNFSLPEKQFIHTVAKNVSGYHFANIAMSVFHINPITFVLLSIAAGSFSNVAADSPIPYIINDGFPPRGEDVCAEVSDTLKCEQFYVTQNSTTLATSYSLLYGEYPESGDSAAAKEVWDCMKSDTMKGIMKQILDDPAIISKFGAKTVDITNKAPQTQMEFNIQGLSDGAEEKFNIEGYSCEYNPPTNSSGLDPIVKWSLVGMGIVAGSCILGCVAKNYYNHRKVMAAEKNDSAADISSAVAVGASVSQYDSFAKDGSTIDLATFNPSRPIII